MSCGLEVENLILNFGFICATFSNSCAKLIAFSFCSIVAFLKLLFGPPPYHKYESTFCPRRVTSLYPCLNKSSHSFKILSGSLLLSLPLVYGTTQKVHILSQPLVIDTKAVTPLLPNLTGLMSAYVSSLDKITFTAFLPSFASFIKLGRSLYESGPTTMSTNFSSSKNFSFKRSAIQPNTPTIIEGFDVFLIELYSSNLFLTVCSALSLIEQVLTKTKSAFVISFVVLKFSFIKIEATTSLSAKFI